MPTNDDKPGMQAVPNSRCPRCQREFHCGIDDAKPCWCATKFPGSVSGDAGATCLCPDCLAARILQQANPENPVT
ncbi:MAG: cysteine-rich CWC family protein [Burkholderiales bacterium]